ncbi:MULTISPECIES: S41 family peptidase [Peptoniphilus]|jgi:peptidase, S41 family|uniref:S41 family peptidase n=2 Tax=Peptoniphilaceae TaxID=1570339 RepID=UPI0008DA570E|nr:MULTISPECIES: S41 family peptidase [Peptoniphilus]MBS6610274.1 S41 family peptidase [Peptoniphilus harei]MDU1954474.1 S41 family peptidase [Peptoniphilus lacydonensis]MDU2115485.1 S41 family peptidase [Peptoniphilus lacydonensis]MDU5275400.1 S41 family peptidase [Peptoniphilus lacydonensis]MDU5377046.1 S41 family peptidase [Peptoniphilus lacydonensis]
MKKNKILKIAAVVLLIVTTAFITRMYTVKEILGNNRDFGKVILMEDYLKENYLYNKEIKEENLETGILKGLVAGLEDPYSQYLTKDEMKKLQEQTTGKFQGIGVIISPAEDGTVTVISPIKGSPADGAGLESGDKILKINGKDFNAEKIEEASKEMRGEAGSTVDLLVLKKKSLKTEEVSIKRDEIKIDSVIKNKIGDIGYIGITMFDEDTGKDFVKVLDELTKENVKGIILDMRGNPGGVVDSAVEIGDAILPKGTFVTLKNNKNEIIDEYKLDENYNNIKMVVLVNEGSASASEILAGAISDLHRAKIVGKTTYGKGVVQNVIGLPDGDGLKLTISEYFTPSGKSINKKGVKPDVEVELPEDIKGIGVDYKDTDTQLKKAIEMIEK